MARAVFAGPTTDKSMHAALPLIALLRLGFGGAPTPVRPLADPEAFRALVQATQTSGRAAVVKFSSTRCKACLEPG